MYGWLELGVYLVYLYKTARRFGVKTSSVYLVSSSFHLHGEYLNTAPELTKAQIATEQSLAQED